MSDDSIVGFACVSCTLSVKSDQTTDQRNHSNWDPKR